MQNRQPVHLFAKPRPTFHDASVKQNRPPLCADILAHQDTRIPLSDNKYRTIPAVHNDTPDKKCGQKQTQTASITGTAVRQNPHSRRTIPVFTKTDSEK